MVTQVVTPTTQACVWMSAGLLTYKLCDRDFDCEHCPLDAALRGAPRLAGVQRNATGPPTRRPVTFPEDRLYSTGHTWLKPIEGGEGRVRLGLDGFASSIVACPRRIWWRPSRGQVRRGQVICEIEFDGGTLALTAPVVARPSRCNRALEDDPSSLVTSPYADGWVLELVPAVDGELRSLLTASAAREQARLDSRRFRRRVAIQLLADDNGNGRSEPDEDRMLTDLRQILGGSRYLALVRELVH
jgi:glycine cleavage system H lipoate-binding protein